jgi:hypothetical protein
VPPWQVVIDKPHNIRKGVTKFLESLLLIDDEMCLIRRDEQLLDVQNIYSLRDLAEQWRQSNIS